VGHSAAEELNDFSGGQDGRRGEAAARSGNRQRSGGGDKQAEGNPRPKRGNACWLAEHVGPFVELLALAGTLGWSEFRAANAA
jgi:hypothetical protein